MSVASPIPPQPVSAINLPSFIHYSSLVAPSSSLTHPAIASLPSSTTAPFSPAMDPFTVEMNSSDFEGLDDDNADSIFALNPNIGKKVVTSILANQAEDRVASKKSARNQPFARGAPMTREAQQSVTAIWDAWCATVNHEFVHSPKQCPSGEQIFRFLASPY